jgi:hypothetical protein
MLFLAAKATVPMTSSPEPAQTAFIINTDIMTPASLAETAGLSSLMRRPQVAVMLFAVARFGSHESLHPLISQRSNQLRAVTSSTLPTAGTRLPDEWHTRRELV